MAGRKGREIKTTVYQKFRGADFSTDPALVDKTRSPLCTNMISDGGGMPEKRCGWRSLASFGERINGIFSAIYKGESFFYVHAGSRLYVWNPESGETQLKLENLRDGKSRGQSLGGKYWIVTGGEYICCRGENAMRVRDMESYIPTTVITRQPSGGGVIYEAINLLNPFRRNAFQTDGEATVFLLDSDNIDTAFDIKSTALKENDLYFENAGSFWCIKPERDILPGERLQLNFAEKYASAGESRFVMEKKDSPYGMALELFGTLSEDSAVRAQVWGESVENFSVNRAEGTVTFDKAPSAPGAGQADGLTVTFPKRVETYGDMIDRCSIITSYGVGSSDRIVLSGNPDYPGRDWMSALNDPTYFPDLGYSVVGLEGVPILGYCKMGDLQAIVKADNGQDSTVFFRSAEVDTEGNVVFPLRRALAGVGAVSEGGFATLLDEPLFVSGTGIYAVSVNYLTGDRSGQNRSYYINSRLRGEELSESEAISWNGMYLLAFPNGHAYVLDGRQSRAYRSESLGDFVYEGYYWENIPARCWLNFENNGEESLFFGTEDGKLCRFNTDMESLDRFSDDGEAIDSVWATKMDDDGSAVILKTMLKRGCSVTLKPYKRSSTVVSFRTDKDPGAHTSVEGAVDIFSWEDMDFGKFSFDSNDSPREIFFGRKLKKYKRLQIIARNCKAGEGFGIFAISKNYVEGNYAKR